MGTLPVIIAERTRRKGFGDLVRVDPTLQAVTAYITIETSRGRKRLN